MSDCVCARWGDAPGGVPLPAPAVGGSGEARVAKRQRSMPGASAENSQLARRVTQEDHNVQAAGISREREAV
jgi:hypothetical protein